MREEREPANDRGVRAEEVKVSMRTSSRLSLSPPSRAASSRESASLQGLRSCSPMARSMRASRNLRAWSARVKGVKGRRRGRERRPAAKRSKAASMRGSLDCGSAPMKSDPAMAKPIAFNSGTHLKSAQAGPAVRVAIDDLLDGGQVLLERVGGEGAHQEPLAAPLLFAVQERDGLRVEQLLDVRRVRPGAGDVLVVEGQGEGLGTDEARGGRAEA